MRTDMFSVGSMPRLSGSSRVPGPRMDLNQRLEMWSRIVAREVAQRPALRTLALVLWALSWVSFLLPLLRYAREEQSPPRPAKPQSAPCPGRLPPPQHPWQRRIGDVAADGANSTAPLAAAAALTVAGGLLQEVDGDGSSDEGGSDSEYDAGFGEGMSVSLQLPARANVCVVRRPGRVHRIVEPARADDNVSETTAYFADDGCALGHLVKDATNLASHAADGGRVSFVVFSHPCATAKPPPRRRGSGIGPSSQLFHDVILHWFRAAQWAAGAAQRPVPTLLYTAQLPTRVCYRSLLGRSGWRWFRTSQHAALFRRGLWNALQVPVPPQPESSPKLAVYLLRRRHNRRYGEMEHAEYLRPRLSGVADIRVTNFEAMRYAEQIRTLRAADVLVGAHGAGMASVVGMRAGTCVVELFPHNFRYLMFEELARVSALHYFPYEARRVSGSCCRPRTLQELSNSSLQPMYVYLRRVNGLRACKNCDIAIDQQELWYVVKDAISARLLSDSRSSDVHRVDRRG